MKLKTALLSVGMIVALSGCAGTIPVNYVPQNIVRYSGDTNVGQFTYAPSENGKVAENQLQNTAVGKIFLPSKISELVMRATALELEKTGIKISDSDISLSGEVIEFKADDLGYSVDWTYSIRYTITNASGAKVVDKVYAADPKKTGKFGLAADFSSSINDMILSGYSKFISDPEVRAALSAK